MRRRSRGRRCRAAAAVRPGGLGDERVERAQRACRAVRERPDLGSTRIAVRIVACRFAAVGRSAAAAGRGRGRARPRRRAPAAACRARSSRCRPRRGSASIVSPSESPAESSARNVTAAFWKNGPSTGETLASADVAAAAPRRNPPRSVLGAASVASTRSGRAAGRRVSPSVSLSARRGRQGVAERADHAAQRPPPRGSKIWKASSMSTRRRRVRQRRGGRPSGIVFCCPRHEREVLAAEHRGEPHLGLRVDRQRPRSSSSCTSSIGVRRTSPSRGTALILSDLADARAADAYLGVLRRASPRRGPRPRSRTLLPRQAGLRREASRTDRRAEQQDRAPTTQRVAGRGGGTGGGAWGHPSRKSRSWSTRGSPAESRQGGWGRAAAARAGTGSAGDRARSGVRGADAAGAAPVRARRAPARLAPARRFSARLLAGTSRRTRIGSSRDRAG